MAVREFDGTDDLIVLDDGTIGAWANGAHSLVMLVKPTTLGTTDLSYFTAKAGAAGAGGGITGLYNDSPNNIAVGGDAHDSTANVGAISTTAWQLLGFSKASGTVAPRMHRVPLSGSSTHTNGGATVANVATDVASFIIDAYTTSGGGQAFRGAAVAIFSTELSDGDWEAIQATPSTQKLADLGAVALWDLNQASTGTDVVDLIGDADQVAITGTTVITDDDPPGWTFGLGGGEVWPPVDTPAGPPLRVTRGALRLG